MTKFLSDEQYGQLQRRLAEVARRADQGTIPFTSTMENLQDIIEGSGLIHGLFATPAQQLAMVKMLNRQPHWRFTEEDFIQLGQAPILLDRNRLTVTILEVLLSDLRQTFETAWGLAAGQQPERLRRGHLESDANHLRLLAGQHQRGLKWRVVDLGANQGCKPIDVCTPETSPAAAILWMAFYSPMWVQAMNGKDIPFVWLPGYEVCYLTAESWHYLPILRRRDSDHQLEINVIHGDNKNDKWAVPAYLE